MNTAQGLFTFFLSIINNYIVPVVFAVAFLMFLIGVYRYFIAGGASEEKVQEGQKFVLWSVIGFVIMFSIWGLVNLFINTLGFDSNTRPSLPTFGAQGNTTNNANTNAGNPGIPGGSTVNQIGGPSNGSVGQGGSCAGNENACTNSLTCDTVHGNVCTAIPRNGSAGNGASCIGNQNACTNGLICDTNTDTCLAPPGNGTIGRGGSCLGNQNACTNGLTCDDQNTDTCVPGSGANINTGSACTGSCVDGSTPDPNTCDCANGSASR
jgi:hypothetical protein